ncbi:MAG: universal stress protein [Ignavibacteria bacterium]|jgi:nucleotide-binding universal stress UspA family protein|nr:universal stress protein [Ignavibacteria bacterium]MDH7528967.1 universal stress protein [Ignavibacteria bacterium]NPV10289.1 universal stress protein [Ignavibacteria bacterium]
MELTISKILIPIDFSEYSKMALDYAVQFAKKFNSELTLIYVIEPIVYPSDFGLGQIPINQVDFEIQSRAEEELKKLIEEKVPSEIKASYVVKTGKPFLEIINTAKECNCDLIIIASHGHTGIEHILFGSTAEKVVRKSPISVLTVREKKKKD